MKKWAVLRKRRVGCQVYPLLTSSLDPDRSRGSLGLGGETTAGWSRLQREGGWVFSTENLKFGLKASLSKQGSSWEYSGESQEGWMWWEKVLESLTISASYFLKYEWVTKPACVRLWEKEVGRCSCMSERLGGWG